MSGPGSRLYVSGGSNPETFDFYIGPSGSDSNDGLTTGTPWAMTAINNAGKRTLYAGKRIGVMDGTYGTITLFGQPSGAWTTNAIVVQGGSSGSPTVLKSINRFGAVIDGEKSILVGTGEQGLIGPNSSYVTIDGFEIKNANYQAVAYYNKDNFTLQNCWLHDQIFSLGGTSKNAATVYGTGSNNCLFRNLLVETGGSPADGNRHDFFLNYGDSSGDSTGNIWEYITIQNVANGGNCVYFKVSNGNNHSHKIRYCSFDRSANPGVGTNFGVLVAGSDNTSDVMEFYGNIIDPGTDRAPLFLTQSNPGGHAGILRWYNNTCVGDWSTDGGISTTTGTPDPVIVDYFNNVLQRTATNGDVRVPTMASIRDMDYNYYDTSPSMSVVVAGGAGSGTYTTIGSWRTASSKDANSVTGTDVLFVGTGDFAAAHALQGGSAAKITGLNAAPELGAYGAPDYDGLGIGYSAVRT